MRSLVRCLVRHLVRGLAREQAPGPPDYSTRSDIDWPFWDPPNFESFCPFGFILHRVTLLLKCFEFQTNSGTSIFIKSACLSWGSVTPPQLKEAHAAPAWGTPPQLAISTSLKYETRNDFIPRIDIKHNIILWLN